jgi:hypothetical protein
MATNYIQFDAPISIPSKDGSIKRSLKKAIVNALTKVLPLANPDFDNRIEDVMYWLVEFDTDSGIPQREIGIDSQGRAIMKMPHNKNYGFWTDNNLLLEDFKKHFNVSEISKNNFEETWELFDKITAFEIELSDYKVLSTGVDGGRLYLSAEIIYKGEQRKLVVYFADKLEEQKITPIRKIKCDGRLLDQGKKQSLSLLDAKLLKGNY